MLDNAKDQCTVKDLKELLNELSNNGYDNMPIFLGNKTPLLNDAICISYAFDVGVYFKNTHYDKELVNAADQLKNEIDVAVKKYIAHCYYGIGHKINNKYHNMFSEFEQKLKEGESNNE